MTQGLQEDGIAFYDGGRDDGDRPVMTSTPECLLLPVPPSPTLQQRPSVFPAYLQEDEEGSVMLPEKYQPGNWDVICQRGKSCIDHVGNRRFKVCIKNHLDRYMNATTRQEKSDVITVIVRSIRSSSTNMGGFVMQVSKRCR